MEARGGTISRKSGLLCAHKTYFEKLRGFALASVIHLVGWRSVYRKAVASIPGRAHARLWAQSSVEGMQEADDRCLTLTSVSISSSLFLPSLFKKNLKKNRVLRSLYLEKD